MFMDKKFTFDMPVAFIVHGYFGSMEDSGKTKELFLYGFVLFEFQ